MGPHSLYMDPPEVLRRFAEEAHRVGVGAHFHLSESSEQLENSLAAHGMTPAAHADSLGLFDLPEPALVAHSNAATDEDLELLAEKGVWVAHTPKTYQKLAMEMPPVARMLAAGVNLAGLRGQLRPESKWAPLAGRLERYYLASMSYTIAAGTSEVQRNIIAMRGLGLPRG